MPSGIGSGTLSGMTTDDKVRENRLRRMAARQGLKLERSRRRDPLAVDYGLYQLIKPTSTARPRYTLTLDAAEEILSAGVVLR